MYYPQWLSRTRVRAIDANNRSTMPTFYTLMDSKTKFLKSMISINKEKKRERERNLLLSSKSAMNFIIIFLHSVAHWLVRITSLFATFLLRASSTRKVISSALKFEPSSSALKQQLNWKSTMYTHLTLTFAL